MNGLKHALIISTLVVMALTCCFSTMCYDIQESMIILLLSSIAFAVAGVCFYKLETPLKDDKFFIILVYTLMFVTCICTAAKLNEYDKQYGKLEPLEQRLKDYEAYYNATEEFLDSIGIDADNPTLSSDCGVTYLKTKKVIDELPN